MSLTFRSVIDQFFGGSFDVELKCVENEEESVSKSKEQFLQLSCFISQDLRYMHSGLKNVSNLYIYIYLTEYVATIFLLQKMQEQITKKSPTLDRDAVYTKTVSITC